MKGGLNKGQKRIKRLFDLFFAFIGLLVLFIPILILIILATISTGKFGLYTQNRIGLHGRSFVMYKVRSMTNGDDMTGITLKNDPRITGFGRWIRNYKLDELPQLWNVLIGQMSLVGPRPDIRGYADTLSGEDRIILTVRPGITGPATLKYKNEEEILSEQSDPLKFNDNIIWKDKVRINRDYVMHWSLKGDIYCIMRTIFD